jgi:hypothetical protein
VRVAAAATNKRRGKNEGEREGAARTRVVRGDDVRHVRPLADGDDVRRMYSISGLSGDGELAVAADACWRAVTRGR